MFTATSNALGSRWGCRRWRERRQKEKAPHPRPTTPGDRHQRRRQPTPVPPRFLNRGDVSNTHRIVATLGTSGNGLGHVGCPTRRVIVTRTRGGRLVPSNSATHVQILIECISVLFTTLSAESRGDCCTCWTNRSSRTTSASRSTATRRSRQTTSRRATT